MDSLPWVEKYRPSNLSNLKGKQSRRLERIATLPLKEIPHMIFHGPAGSGKNTHMVALMKRIYGEKWKEKVRIINASEERGIQNLRSLTKYWSNNQGENAQSFVIFDEAGKLTQDFQQALRRKMESNTKTIRFGFLLNDLSKLILPIRSRAEVFYFPPLTIENAISMLNTIVKEEKIMIKKPELESIIHCTDGDLRKSITLLYSVSVLADSKQVTKEMIEYTSGDISNSCWESILSLPSEQQAYKMGESLCKESINFKLLLKRIHQHILACKSEDSRKANFLIQLSEWESEYLEGKNLEILFQIVLLELFTFNQS